MTPAQATALIERHGELIARLDPSVPVHCLPVIAQLEAEMGKIKTTKRERDWSHPGIDREVVEVRTCRTCGHSVLWCVNARDIVADPYPLDVATEIAVLSEGRSTYDLVPYGGSIATAKSRMLEFRDLRALRANREFVVVPQHWHETWTAVTYPPPPPPADPAEDVPPF